jgi:fimbrial isopeptide formation D2 family protein/LPXTG-motif cell wall-anchored protein
MMKARTRKTLACIFATSLVLSCMASMPTSATFTSDSGNSLTVVDPQNRTDRKYDLYQIFSGTLKSTDGGESLVNVQWGQSIKYSGDGVSYDLSTTLVDALKGETLPDGETNPIASDFQSVTKNASGGYDAANIVDIISQYANNGEKIDAFMSAVGDVIEDSLEGNTAIQKMTTDYSGTEETTGSLYIFEGLESGYYMVSESTDSSKKITYSKYLATVGVGERGTTIEAKSSGGPSLEKKIEYDDESLHDYQNVAVGDTVRFHLSSEVPDMNGYNRYYFVIDDTLSESMTYYDNAANWEVKVGDTTLSRTENTTATSPSYEIIYNTNDDGTTSIRIVFKNFIQYKDQVDQDITVCYNATVDEDVTVGETDVNTNKAHLTYSNNPNYNYKGTPADDDNPGDPDQPDTSKTGGDPTISTPDDTVYIYTAALDIIKVDGDGNRLNGAVFKITGDGNTAFSKILKVVPTYTAAYYSDSSSVEAVTAESSESSTTNSDGTETSAPTTTTSMRVQATGAPLYYKLKDGAYTADVPTDHSKSRYESEKIKYDFEGNELLNGEYYMTEEGTTVAIEDATENGVYKTGYVLYTLDEEKTLEDVETGNPVATLTCGDNGIVSVYGLNAGTYTIEEVTAPSGYNKLEGTVTITITFVEPNKNNWKCGWIYEKTSDTTNGNLVTLAENNAGVGEVVVKNLTIHSLPSTGGIGTTIFYAAGSALAIAASVLLITKKRMHGESDHE